MLYIRYAEEILEWLIETYAEKEGYTFDKWTSSNTTYMANKTSNPTPALTKLPASMVLILMQILISLFIQRDTIITMY